MSKLFVSKIPYVHYAEISQKSPMRWVLLSPPKDGVLSGVSSWFKCKDFFNDVVAYFKLGQSFSMYSFRNDGLCKDDSFYYVGVNNVGGSFKDHIALLNAFLKSKEFPEVFLEEVDSEGNKVEFLLKIPALYFDNTFEISWLSSFIRAGTYPGVSGFESALAIEPTLSGYYEKIEKELTNVKKANRDLDVFLSFQYNARNCPAENYVIHDAGFQTWLNTMEAS